MDLETRLIELDENLDEFKPSHTASWQLAQLFNVLLEEVNKAHPDDPVAKTILPSEQTAIPNVSTSDCGSLRAATAQLLAAVRGA
jgi:hypothetical protein